MKARSPTEQVRQSVKGWAALSLLPLLACSGNFIATSNIRSSAKSLAGKPQDGVLFANGRWVRTSAKKSPSMATINTVTIDCYRTEGRCVEAVASLYSSRDAVYQEVVGPEPYLGCEMTEFRVVEWSATLIRALSQPRAADIEIRISLPDNAVRRTSSETSARGAVGADPTPELWTLQ